MSARRVLPPPHAPATNPVLDLRYPGWCAAVVVGCRLELLPRPWAGVRKCAILKVEGTPKGGGGGGGGGEERERKTTTVHAQPMATCHAVSPQADTIAVLHLCCTPRFPLRVTRPVILSVPAQPVACPPPSRCGAHLTHHLHHNHTPAQSNLPPPSPCALVCVCSRLACAACATLMPSSASPFLGCCC